MSERPTTNKYIHDTLDVLVVKVTRIEENLLNQPKIDEQKEKAIDLKFYSHERRIADLESNQKWVVFAILGIILNAVMQLVLH